MFVADGGAGSYTYEWSGDDITGIKTTQSISEVYSSIGTKQAEVSVSSGSESVGPISCSSISVVIPPNLVTCSVRASAFIGDELTWTAIVGGGVSYGSILWTGDVVGSGTSVSATYNTEGQKTGTATVYDVDGLVMGSCTTSTVIRKNPNWVEF